MTTSVLIDPLFGDGGAAMVELATRFGRYRSYAKLDPVDTPLGRALPPRYDSLRSFVRTGGRAGRTHEDPATLAARTGYFREEYAYGSDVFIDGIEPFLRHEALVDAAKDVHGATVVEPVIAYANLMVPGQELAVHTDVPEMRGIDRKVVPQWLLVAMHHSGLFERWRLRIATGIGWFSAGPGGELSWWPDGPDAPVRLHDGRPDTALVLDTDSVFHGVDTVGGSDEPAPPVTAGSTLAPAGDGSWVVSDADGVEQARYPWERLRLSVSWKAYCFADEAERTVWRDHTDDLTADAAVDRLVADLAARGLVAPDAPHDKALALAIIDAYIRFPAEGAQPA